MYSGSVRTREGYWGTPWSEEEIEYLRTHYSIKPVKDIAIALGRSYTAVTQRARIEGLKSRHRSGINSLTPDYFRTIDTPNKAYLLGLYTADGSVSRQGQVALALHEKDKELVEFARDQIAPGARLSFHKTKTSPMVKFHVSSPDLVADLAAHGVVSNKSLVTKWPVGIPDWLTGSYISGYFDGDGSLSTSGPYPRWTIVSGNPDFLESIIKKIHHHTGIVVGGPYKDIRHEHAWSIVQVGSPVQTIDEWTHRYVSGLTRKRLN